MSYTELLEKFFALLRLFLDGEERHPFIRRWAEECLGKQEVLQLPPCPKKFKPRGQMISALGLAEGLFTLATARRKAENLQRRLERACIEVKNIQDNAEHHLSVIEEQGSIETSSEQFARWRKEASL